MKKICLLASLLLVLPTIAAADPISAFTLFGGNSTSLGSNVIVNSGLVGSNANVSLGGGSDTLTVLGAGVLSGGSNLSINSTGDVIFNGNVGLGGGSHATGDVDSGGNVVLGTSAIVDGNVRAAGKVTLGGSATVGGDVDAGLATGIAIDLGTNAKVLGNATHKAGTTISIGGGSSSVGANIVGTPAAPVPYVATVLPTPSVFSAGVTNVTKGGSQTTNLAPGSYNDIVLGSTNILNLSTGSYFFNTWDIGGGSTINFDLTSGGISLFFTGNVGIGNNLNVVLLNGDASDIYAETYGDWTLNGGGEWFGTIFGSGVGSDVHFGNNNSLTGAIFATRNLDFDGGSTANLLQADYLTNNSVPEPGTLILLGSGLLGLVLVGRRKFRK